MLRLKGGRKPLLAKGALLNLRHCASMSNKIMECTPKTGEFFLKFS
jgi:hypothetical protein